MGFTIDPISSWINLAASDLSSNLMLIGLDLINQPTMSTFPYIKVTGSLVPYSTLNGASGTLYLGSFGNLPQTPPSTGFTNCLSISTMNVASISGVSWTPSYMGSYYNNAAYYPKKVSYYASGTGNSALFISADSGNGGILLIKQGISPTPSIESYVYQENNNDILQTLDISAASINQAYVMFKN